MCDMEIIKLPYINSTNTYAKDNAQSFSKKITVIQAERQLQGRGRLGRDFLSDNSDGAWFSVVIKPEKDTISPRTVLLMPILAAGETAAAIEDICGIKAGIKWPNDILINGKKVCGILCESSVADNSVLLIIIGIGINVNQKEMHPDIADIATSLFMETSTLFSVDLLVQNICGNIACSYDKIRRGNTAGIIDKWNEYSIMNNAVITYTKGQSLYSAVSKGIDRQGRLIAEQDGLTIYLDSSEISIKSTRSK